MNVYQKLNKVRAEFHSLEIRKTGENKFAGYKYFELADFVIPALNLMDKHGLTAMVTYGSDKAQMAIVNNEKPDEVLFFTSPMSEANLKGCHPVQNLGAVQTYIRRYLWVAALEIVEHDAVDSSKPVDEPKPEPKRAEKVPAKMQGQSGEFQITVQSEDSCSQEEWLNIVKDAAHMLLEYCHDDADVMKIFKKNKVIFDRVKEIDPAFFKEMMGKFTENKNKFAKG